MPYTVGGAFDKFREAKVDIDKDETPKAKKSRDYLVDQLKSLTAKDYTFPTIFDYLKFGSFARKTQIQPLDDIDIMPLLKTGAAEYFPTSEQYHYKLKAAASSPLSYFNDDYGYVSSIRLLNKLKALLASVPNYQSADKKRNYQAVVLNLKSYTWSFDIVPACEINGVSGCVESFLIPDGSGNWMKTDPRIDKKNITDENQRHDSKFIPTVRLLKYWKELKYKNILSYYFETLAIQVFRHATPISNFQYAIYYFFKNCPSFLLASCPDPKGLGPNLDAGIDWNTKQNIVESMKYAADYSYNALVYEEKGMHKEAIFSWQQVFGKEFPNYGW